MKLFILFVFILSLAGIWYVSGGSLSSGYELGEYVEVQDLNGRTLKCKVTAKRGHLLRVLRHGDQQQFIIPAQSLDGSSRQHFTYLDDFNESALNEAVYETAEKQAKIELFYNPDTCYFICPHNGERLNTQEGANLDAFKEFLEGLNLRYDEVRLDPKEVGRNGGFHPARFKDLPCLRIGNTNLYQRSESQVREAILDDYFTATSS